MGSPLRKNSIVSTVVSPFRKNSGAVVSPRASDARAADARLSRFQRTGSNRTSSVFDKRQNASNTATDRSEYDDGTEEMETLLDRVRTAFDEVAGQGVDGLEPTQFGDALRFMLEAVSLEELFDDVEAFARLEESGKGAKEYSVEEFGAKYKRFESWAKERQILRDAGIPTGTLRLELQQNSVHSSDKILLAAAQHCRSVQSLHICNATLHNSTLTTLAQQLKGQLLELDLSGSRGFDNLGIKAFAAYCPELTSIAIAGCPLTDEGLVPLFKCCPKLRALTYAEHKKIHKCLVFLATDCEITVLPPTTPATSATKGGSLFTRARTTNLPPTNPNATATAPSADAPASYDPVESIE